MSAQPVEWPVLPPSGGEPSTEVAEGLRERKKRLMRRQLSDTATRLFLERGFDGVRVAEIAEACRVSEKTVFNYFPTKESLVLDRWSATQASLEALPADSGASAVEDCLRVLTAELTALTDWLASQEDRAGAVAGYRRFGELLRETPQLRAYQRDAADRLADTLAGLLARRSGTDERDPQTRIAATALVGLWEVQFRSLGRYLSAAATPDELHARVTSDVRRAADVLEHGLGSVPGLG